MHPLLLVLIMFIVAGCATTNTATEPAKSVPESSVEAMTDTTQSTGSSEAVPVSSVEALEAPNVTETSVAMIPYRPEPEEAIVCESEPRPGYILPVKICRHKEYIELRQAADQELFDDIKRNTALFTSRLF